ncbi:MAG: PAS domain-containing sensor histidine kinase, partial [Acidobacteriia bacterium]|nr:PAS domain-containing sensor histidine kinase [Terriglobia bacterium]
YESFAESLGDALTHQKSAWALRERVKELTCLYGIAQVAERPGITLEEMLRCIAELLPPGWQYPSECSARIVLDGRSHPTAGFREGPHRQAADIVVDGVPRGSVEVFYTEEKPPLDEGPFLREERSLIHEVARQVALILSRRQAETEKARLQDQLRHADRLVTIGQLAAGAAHELNEPLGGILGFAQLAGKHEKLPPEVRRDLEKIVRSALHARDVVRKLMLFARQTPPRKMRVDLNRLVAEGIMFVEPRFAAEGIVLRRRLATDLPEIVADPGQMHQVIVNLVVNGLQAMPEGGTLTLETRAGKDHVVLAVEDTGTGMTEDVVERVFMPFFTTKDIGQGTGLGLSMVHGIVTSHGGSIRVDSKPGRGSRFEVRLPRRSAGDAAKREEGNGAVGR